MERKKGEVMSVQKNCQYSVHYTSDQCICVSAHCTANALEPLVSKQKLSSFGHIMRLKAGMEKEIMCGMADAREEYAQQLDVWTE